MFSILKKHPWTGNPFLDQLVWIMEWLGFHQHNWGQKYALSMIKIPEISIHFPNVMKKSDWFSQLFHEIQTFPRTFFSDVSHLIGFSSKDTGKVFRQCLCRWGQKARMISARAQPGAKKMLSFPPILINSPWFVMDLQHFATRWHGLAVGNQQKAKVLQARAFGIARIKKHIRTHTHTH